jgi:hypothetical protein
MASNALLLAKTMRKRRRRSPPYLRHPIWDTHLVPGISQIAEHPIKAIPRALKPDPLQFVITSILLELKPTTRARTLNFIRRAREVHEEYDHARRDYRAFFKDEENAQKYLDALHHFEVCLASAYQGHELLFGGRDAPFFDKAIPGRAELNWRMNRLYNSSKHTEGMIRSSQFDGKTLAMWISNEGLQTGSEKISFIELHHIVFDMSLTACILAKSYLWRKKPLPNDLRRYLNQLYGERPGHLERSVPKGDQ